MDLVFKQVHMLKKLQYNIKEDVIVKDYINSRLILSENELNDKASIVENLDESKYVKRIFTLCCQI